MATLDKDALGRALGAAREWMKSPDDAPKVDLSGLRAFTDGSLIVLTHVCPHCGARDDCGHDDPSLLVVVEEDG